EKALADFTAASRLNRADPMMAFGRGAALTFLKRYEKAIEAFTEAIRLHPQLSRAYVARGSALSWLNRSDEAMADYNRGIELTPGEAKDGYRVRLRLYQAGKKFRMG